MEYPKWHKVADTTPLCQVQAEIDNLRARLDAAGIAKIEQGSGSEKYGASDWTAAGRNAEGFPVAKGSPEDVTLPTQAEADAASKSE